MSIHPHASSGPHDDGFGPTLPLDVHAHDGLDDGGRVAMLERRVETERAARRRAEWLLRQAYDKLAAPRAPSAVLANLNHEIRTPLTSIIGYAELMLQPAIGPDAVGEAARTIIRNGRHLIDVADDILDLAKIETRDVAGDRRAHAPPGRPRDLGTAAAEAVRVPELAGRVLVVDDSPDIRRLLACLLEQAGLTVALADNGRRAVDAALREPFDLVLMDAQMPEMDGSTATRTLRAAGYGGPIVVLTANVMEADIARYRDAGCNAVLAKPIDREQFFEVVTRHLAGDGDGDGDRDRDGGDDTDADGESCERELQRLAAEFSARLPARIAGIRAALGRRDWPALASLAHSLRGSAGFYGHDALTRAAGAVDDALRAGDMAAGAALCGDLQVEAERVLRLAPASAPRTP